MSTASPKQFKELEKLSRPLIEFLNNNFHPHTKIIIETDSAELVEGICAFKTTAYIKD